MNLLKSKIKKLKKLKFGLCFFFLGWSYEDFGENGVNVKLKYIIPTMYDPRTKMSKEVVEYAKKEYGVIVTNPIHRSVKLEEAPGHSKTIFEYDSFSQPAKDYKILAERILSENKK